MRITDLGVSFISKERKPLKPRGNYAYLLTGTDLYMAPEIEALKEATDEDHKKWKAADPEEKECINAFYGPAADWFSYGVLTYEMAVTSYLPRVRGSVSFEVHLEASSWY